MKWALLGIAGWLILGALASVGFIGKERKPLTASGAILSVIITAFEAVVLIMAAGYIRR